MKLLSWNTAFGRATHNALALAHRLSVEVVLLQEAQPPTTWPGAAIGAAVRDRSWGSWILVRGGTLESRDIPNYSGWVTGALWRHEQYGALHLFSVHSPTPNNNERRGGYVTESLRIVEAIASTVPQNERLVIAGDFNFRSFGERLPTEDLQTTAEELKALRAFRACGLSLAWRDICPTSPLPQTLRWKSAPAVPFHCDGFLTRGFSATSLACEILSGEADIAGSDHNPVLLQLFPSDAARLR